MLGEYLRRFGFWVIDFLKGSPIRKNYRDITQMLSDDEYCERQKERYLKKLLDDVCNYTDFYKEYKGVYDLQNFPVINKNMIRDRENEFLSRKFDKEKLHTILTSGSTGIPFKAYQNKGKRNRVLAAIIYYGNKIGYRVGKRLVYLRFLEENTKKSRLKQFIQNERIYRVNNMNDKNIKNICKEMMEFKAETTILGYPSTLSLIADTFNDMGISRVNKVSGIIAIAEALSMGNRRKLEELFNCPIISRYSNQENGVLAQEGDIYNEYYINKANYIIEILKLDSDERAKEDEVGRIVITDLFNSAMPMIRYDTGDIASLINKSINGKDTQILTNLEGRRLDMLFDTSGDRISPFSIDEVFHDLLYVRQYQLIQKTKKNFTIKLVCKDKSDVEEDKIMLRLKAVLGLDASIELIYSEGIPVTNSGKFKYIISHSNKTIPLSVPNLSVDIVNNIIETVETGWVSTGGRFIKEFEDKIAAYVGAKRAVSCQSGTAGLHLALRVLGIGYGDEVIVPTVTFIAAVNPVKYMKAEPIFMDCDDSLNMDMNKLEEFLEERCTHIDGKVINKNTGKQIKAIVVVHVFGNPVDIERLMFIKEKYNLKLVEDATEALGSYYLQGKYAGKYCGTIGDVGVYSFNANKIITTGGGGMIVSNHEEFLDEAAFLSVQAKTDPLYFIHDDIGYNYRMTNIQAAFGVDQILRLEDFIETKIKNYNLYKEAISNIEGLMLLPFKEDTRSNHWFYSIIIDKEKYGVDRDELLRELNECGIQTRPLWGLIHKQRPYLDAQVYRIEKALFYEKTLMNLPCSTNLTEEDIRTVIEHLRKPHGS